MPELPEVETVRRGLEPAMVGARILSVELRRGDLRFPFPPDFAVRLSGRTVVRLGRRAKFLVAELDDGTALLMHLGMSGSFRLEEASYGMPHPFHHPRGKAGAHDHVVFHLSSGARVTYNDPRRFGAMDLVAAGALEENRHLRGLGVEPLGNQFNGPLLARLMAGKKAPLKAALLDQRLIAGLGNIYVCEALWRARLSPLKPASVLARADGKPSAAAERLATAIRTVLEEAVAAGGSSLRDHARTDGSLGDFQHHFSVYDREGEPCPHPGCRGIIHRIVQSGRSTFYCPVSQK